MEIKKSDFLDIIMKNHEDYEKYSMLRDQMKLYNTYKSLQINCFSCSKFSHIHDKCPLVHFIPDKTFIIKRFLHCNNQKRNSGFKRKMKRTLNALLDNNLILNDIQNNFIYFRIFLVSSVLCKLLTVQVS